MKSLLKELGPVLAGFQLATYFVGFFGIGAFASWVLKTWRPFTHWVWDSLFAWLTLPELSELEKDALTAIAFFLPMASWAVYARYVEKKDGPFSLFTRVASIFAGIFFVYLIAGNLILETFLRAFNGAGAGDAENDIASAARQSLENLFSSLPPWFSIASFTILGMFIGVQAYRSVTARKTINALKGNKDAGNAGEKTDVLFSNPVYEQEKTNEPTEGPEWPVDRFRVVSVLIAFMGIMSGLGTLGSLFGSIGWVRGGAVAAVLTCVYITWRFDPRRILVSTGAFLAFVIASIGYESALWISGQMSSVANSTQKESVVIDQGEPDSTSGEQRQ